MYINPYRRNVTQRRRRGCDGGIYTTYRAGAEQRSTPTENYEADPIFGKSNLIFTLASADGLLRIHPDATGLGAGETVEVVLI